MNELGLLLKTLRGKMSLRDVAQISGLSYSYISSIEKGEHPKTKAPVNPSPDTLKRLSKCYNYPYSNLMKKAGYIDDIDDESIYETSQEQLDDIDRQIIEEIKNLSEVEKAKYLQLIKMFKEK